jgi:ABC-type transporter MlaC component
MAWRTWRGLIGGSVAALMLIASATATLAQTASPPSTPAKIAQKPTKPAATKAAAKKPAPAHPAAKLAVAKPKTPVKKFAAAAKKPAPAKTLAVAAKKPVEPTKIAAVAAKPEPASYTVTTTRGNVTYTATRIVPLPATQALVNPVAPATPVVAAVSAPPVIPVVAAVSAPSAPAQIAALPVSLTEPVVTAPPLVKTPVAAVVAKPAPAPEKPIASHPANPDAATAFVANFLKEAFRIAKADDKTSLQRRAVLADLFASKMDVKRIAGYTTSDELTGATADIQKRFRTILVSYLVETYYPRLELASDPTVTVETTPAEPLPDGTAVAWTTFTKDGFGSQSVKWHLAAEDGGFKIVDILSGGASLVQMERDTFLSVMRNGGLNELMAKLDARTKELATAATE